MIRFRNTLVVFALCTALTVPMLYGYYVDNSLYERMLLLLGSTYPPIDWWGPLTSMFIHYNFPHYFFNMVTLWLIGPYFEGRYGGRVFWITYLASGAASSLSPIIYYAMGQSVVVLGSSGALFGIIGFILASPQRMAILSNPINMIMIVFLLTPLASAQGIAYIGHLMGFLVGLTLGFSATRRGQLEY
jgi:membrane associated rhomboid family serine protease